MGGNSTGGDWFVEENAYFLGGSRLKVAPLTGQV